LLFLEGQTGASQATTIALPSALRPGSPQGAAWPEEWAHWKMPSDHTEKRERSKSERDVTFGEERSIACLVATSLFIQPTKSTFALDQFGAVK
jgi:hypothetical protein